MQKTLLHCALFISILIFGCSQDVTTVTIVRNPLIKFEYNANKTWTSGDYTLANMARVIGYPADTTQPGQLYNRLTLQTSGKDGQGDDLQFIVSFDVIDPVQLVGTYTSAYTTQRGLAQVQLYNLTNSNNLVAYDLCSSATSAALFQVQKQNPNERLITGIFQMTLCNARDTTRKITITNGTFKDIRY
jgi:hypothetical protein